MNRQYQIFEVLPNGSASKIVVVTGLECALLSVRELARHTDNECFAQDVKTRQVVAQMNVPQGRWGANKRLFQITYDERLGSIRAELLRSWGYGVISVLGNEKAKVLLGSIQRYDLFIVDHSAPEATRREMVVWLKAQYPKVKILAVNPPGEHLLNADYNVLQNGPFDWLPTVARPW